MNNNKFGVGRLTKCQSCGFKFRILSDEDRYAWEIDKLKCPSCGEEYCNKPESERQLLKLQTQYFENDRDKKYIEQMYLILINYAKSMILKHPARIHLSLDDIDYKAHRSAIYLIENYLRRPDFIITDSFGGYLAKAITHSLHHEDEKPSGDISMQDLNSNENGFSGDYDFYHTCKNIKSFEFKHNAIDLRDKIVDIFFNSFNNVKLSTLIALNVFLNKGEEHSNKFFKYHSKKGKKEFLHLMSRLKNELLKNNIEN